jgi:hypothetical protein
MSLIENQHLNENDQQHDNMNYDDQEDPLNNEQYEDELDDSYMDENRVNYGDILNIDDSALQKYAADLENENQNINKHQEYHKDAPMIGKRTLNNSEGIVNR